MKTDINVVNLTVLIAMILAFAWLDWRNKKHVLLLAIVFVMFATEAMFIICRHARVSNQIFLTLSVIVHAVLWHLVLAEAFRDRNLPRIPIAIFILFAVVNLLWFEGADSFNYLTFIAGSLLYISTLLTKSFSLLKKEELDFFLTNDFWLVGSPVAMFFGLSLVFAFKDLSASSYLILPGISVYQFMICVINLCYYAMIITFVHNEKKLRHAG